MVKYDITTEGEEEELWKHVHIAFSDRKWLSHFKPHFASENVGLRHVESEVPPDALRPESPDTLNYDEVIEKLMDQIETFFGKRVDAFENDRAAHVQAWFDESKGRFTLKFQRLLDLLAEVRLPCDVRRFPHGS